MQLMLGESADDARGGLDAAVTRNCIVVAGRRCIGERGGIPCIACIRADDDQGRTGVCCKIFAHSDARCLLILSDALHIIKSSLGGNMGKGW